MTTDPATSPFLQIPESHWALHNELAFAIFDKYPVNDGHILIIPRRLIPTWFDATTAEQHAISALTFMQPTPVLPVLSPRQL